MKAFILYLFILFTFCLSCSSLKKAAPNVDNDGSSYEKAIVINEGHERQGIADEYAWIRNKYPGSKTQSQSLNHYKNKSYDIIHIVTPDNRQIAIYFDISKFFGKF